PLLSQENHKLRGTIIDSKSKGIPGSTIRFGTVPFFSDAHGHFVIESNGEVALKISSIGYETRFDTVQLNRDADLLFMLREKKTELSEAIIEENSRTTQNSRITNKLTRSEIENIPTAIGIPDVLSSIKTLPGVQSNTEGQKGLIIRGGNYDQTTTSVDGVAIVGTSHLFGLLSTFQTDCVDEVFLYNGFKPPRLGSTLGSAIEVNLKEEFSKEISFNGSASISAISSQVQSSYSNKKLFLQMGYRHSNLFFIQNLINDALTVNEKKNIEAIYGFDDFHFKAAYLFKDHKIQLLHLRSSDDMSYNVDYVESEVFRNNHMSWRNSASSVRWNYYAPNGSIFTANVSSSKYSTGLGSLNRTAYFNGETNQSDWRNSVSAFNNRVETFASRMFLEKKILSELKSNFGYEFKKISIAPHSEEYWEDDPQTQPRFEGNKEVKTHSLFSQLEGGLMGATSFKVGLRANMFRYGEESEFHFNPQASVTHEFQKNLSVALYSLRSSQNVHLITLNTLGFIPELWLAPSEGMPVQRSWSTGAKLSYSQVKTHAFVDVYLRGMSNLLEFGNVDFENSTSEIVENQIATNGQGAVFGFAVSLKSSHKNLHYSVSYSHGKSSRLFEQLNQGIPFAFAFDIRHDANASFTYQIGKNCKLSALYTFASGRVLNVNDQMIPIGFTMPLGGNYTQWASYNQPQNRNSYRLGNLQRLDWSISWKRPTNCGEYNFLLGVYNTTNRVNPYSAFSSVDENGNPYIEEIGLIPLMPNLSISYSWN
ncbi:MAG: TonB-dependent receptor, partial [Flavobacteriales bacterium]